MESNLNNAINNNDISKGETRERVVVSRTSFQFVEKNQESKDKKEKGIEPLNSERKIIPSDGRDGDDSSSERNSEDEESWLNISSILQNPEFRFSNSKSSENLVRKNCGYDTGENYLKNNNERNGKCLDKKNDGMNYSLDYYCIYRNPDSSLHFISKEIIQES